MRAACVGGNVRQQGGLQVCAARGCGGLGLHQLHLGPDGSQADELGQLEVQDEAPQQAQRHLAVAVNKVASGQRGLAAATCCAARGALQQDGVHLR